MNVSSEKSVLLWMGTKVREDAPALDKAEKADVVSVGSGIAGMSVALGTCAGGQGRCRSRPRSYRQGNDLMHDGTSNGPMRRWLSSPGEGAIVCSGVTKVAAYRDEKGQLYLRSALPASGPLRALEQFRALLGLPLSRVAACT